MAIEVPDLQELLDRIRKGDEDAARELLVHFESHVRRVVRRRLPLILRPKFDSMDFVQSVWGEFFARLNQGELEFDSPQRLARFLAVVAQTKVTAEYRRRHGKKHDLRREVSGPNELFYIPGKTGDPTPSQAMIAQERIETVMNSLSDLHKKVLELRNQGFKYGEIAEQLGIDERSARRIVHDVLLKLGRYDARQ